MAEGKAFWPLASARFLSHRSAVGEGEDSKPSSAPAGPSEEPGEGRAMPGRVPLSIHADKSNGR